MTFADKVYKIVSDIPTGKVLTYKQVATKAGNEKAFRAVGTLMKNNPDKNLIPCHRVVGSDGKMCGYAFGGEEVKIQKLKKEGLEIDGDKVSL